MYKNICTSNVCTKLPLSKHIRTLICLTIHYKSVYHFNGSDNQGVNQFITQYQLVYLSLNNKEIPCYILFQCFNTFSSVSSFFRVQSALDLTSAFSWLTPLSTFCNNITGFLQTNVNDICTLQ